MKPNRFWQQMFSALLLAGMLLSTTLSPRGLAKPLLQQEGVSLRQRSSGDKTAVPVVSNAQVTTPFEVAATVEGTVTDAITGWPLYAEITIDGYAGGPLWTNPVTGHYSVSLASGSTYTFTVGAFAPGYLLHDESILVPGNMTKNFTMDADLYACIAPGYTPDFPLFADDFDSVTPPNFSASWGVNTSGGANWATHLGTNFPSGVDAHSTPNLAYLNSFSSPPGAWARLYRTVGVDLSGHSSAQVSFWMYHDLNYSSYQDKVQLQISSDSGASWGDAGYPIYRYDGTTGWALNTVDISYFTGAGMSDVRIGFLGTSGYGNDVHIDDVSLLACSPQPGGLVVGNVYDDNTLAPLPGATVENDNGGVTTTWANLEDLSQAPAFYTLFSPPGVYTYTVSWSYYSPVSGPVEVVANDTIRQDFYLPAGYLDSTPDGLAVTLNMGDSTSLTLTLTNLGGVPVGWSLRELERGRVQGSLLQQPTFMADPSQWGSLDTRNLSTPAQLQAAPLNIGGILQSWPTRLTWAWGLGFDLNANHVWLGNIASNGGDDLDYRFLTDGTNTYDTIDTSGWVGIFAGDMAYNLNTGMLWQVNVGGDNCVHELNPTTLVSTGKKICPSFPVRERGLAYDPSTDTFIAGSWENQMVYRFAPDSTMLEAVNVGLNVAGLAYNPNTQHLFVMTNNSPNPVYVLDAANGYNNLGQFTIDGFTNYGGAGFEMDCGGNLWAVDQYGKTVYQLDSGETTSMCAMDVPWLSESPITGTLPAYITVLWDQPLSVVNQNANVDQDFPDFPTYSSFLADDFISTQPWAISSIYVPGDLWYGGTTLMNATMLHWEIFGNAVGVPDGDPSGGGNAPLFAIHLPPTDAHVTLSNGTSGYPSNVMLNLSTSVYLPAGHYWLVFYPTMGYTTYGQYGRQPADTTNGYGGQFINPGGGFGYGTAWQPWGVIGPTQPDIAFRLAGTAVGTLGPQPSQVVDVTFDAGVLDQPGIYRAQLNINTDTPYFAQNIPITMTINAPPTWGKLDGTVTDLGYCDSNPAPLAGATITIQGTGGYTKTLMTGPDGYYEWWLDQAHSPLTVTVKHPEHQSGQVTGVIMSAGMTTTQNFDLRWQRACVITTPTGFEVTVPQGYSETLPLAIFDYGAVGTEFRLGELPGGFTALKSLAPASGHGEWLYQSTSGVPVTSNNGKAGMAYPKAYRWTPDKPAALNFLIYADDWVHGSPDTFLDQALQRLGIAYTAHYDGDLAGFETDLAGGVWDAVLYEGDAYSTPGTTLTALNTFITSGGRLGAEIWDMYNNSGDPLYTSLGVTYVNNYLTPTLATYWWDPTNGIFTFPYDAPEWASHACPAGLSCGQYVDPVNGVSTALAGYTTSPLAGKSALVLRDDEKTIFKAFIDPSNGDDADSDGVLDGVELWVNIAHSLVYGIAVDVPWISENPIAGNINADNGIDIAVTFITTPTMPVGTYTATLELKSDDPTHPIFNIPVAMQVVVPSFGVSLSPNQVLSDLPGKTVVFTVQVTNTGNAPDTFDLALGTYTYPTTLDTSQVTLAKGASAAVHVTVKIPVSASEGDSDAVTLTATSLTNPTKSASTTLTTIASFIKRYLPLIVKNSPSG